MSQVSESVKQFFSELEHDGNALNLEGLSTKYSETFGFADSDGFKMIRKQDLLEALPQRQKFVQSIGLTSSLLKPMAEEMLDDHYILVKVTVVMRFEKPAREVISDEDATVYILHKHSHGFEIVFQLEGRGLMQKVKQYRLV